MAQSTGLLGQWELSFPGSSAYEFTSSLDRSRNPIVFGHNTLGGSVHSSQIGETVDLGQSSLYLW